MIKSAWGIVLLLPALLGCPGGRDASAKGTAANHGSEESKAPPFSADTAYAYLKKQVAFGPRVPGTPGHQAQLDWMKQFLRERADTLVVQDFTHTHSDTRKPLGMTNLFARFNPSASTRVLLIAHWDTRPTADQDDDRNHPIPGANDGASGTAILLELANVLKRNKPPIGVDLLFVDGEDYGPDTVDMYVGASHFAANLPRGYRPLYGILLDMVGDENPVYGPEGNSQSLAPEVVQRVWNLAEDLGYSQHFPRSGGTTVSDDHLPLNKAGIRTIDIIDFDYGPGNAYWHSVEDSVEHTSPLGLGILGRVMLELIWRGG